MAALTTTEVAAITTSDLNALKSTQVAALTTSQVAKGLTTDQIVGLNTGQIQNLTTPVAPAGFAIVATVEDLQAQTRLKVTKAREAVSVTMDLLAFDLVSAGVWMDVRQLQDPRRAFGVAPTAALTALRGAVPLLASDATATTESAASIARRFLATTPASTFYCGKLPEQAAGPEPTAAASPTPANCRMRPGAN